MYRDDYYDGYYDDYNDRYVYDYDPDDELYHFGVKGMKWGIRRFQNRDGSPTGAGRGRYGRKGVNWKRVAGTAAGLAAGGAALYLAGKNRKAIGAAAGRAINGIRNYDYKANAGALRNRIVNAGRRTWNSATKPYGSINRAMRSAPGAVKSRLGSAFGKVRGYDYKGAAKNIVNNVRNYDYKANAGALRNRVVNAGRRTWNSATKPYGSINQTIRSVSGKALSTARRAATSKTARVALGAGALGAAGSYGYQRVSNSRRRRRR